MSKRTTNFPDHTNRPENRLGFRRNNTNGSTSMIPKALAGQPLKKVNSEPVSMKTKDKLASFAHGNAAPRRDKPLPNASNSRGPEPGAYRGQRPKSPIPAPMDSSPPPAIHKENKQPSRNPSVRENQSTTKIEKPPAKKPSPLDSGLKQQNAASLGSKDIPSTPQHRFALNDLLSQTNVTPSVKVSKEETSPEERVSWADSPKNARRLKRARSSSPMGTPRASKRSSKQTAFDISSSALKTPLTNPFEDAWTKRLQEQPSARVPFVQAEERFEGSSPRGPTDVADSPSAFRRSFSAPTKRLKLLDRKPKEAGRLEEKFAESALRPARSSSLSGRNITNEKVSSLLAKLQENSTKVAVLQKSETAPAAINSSFGTFSGRFDDPSSSIQGQMSPPVMEAGPWEDRSRRSNSTRPPSEVRHTGGKAAQPSAAAAHPKSDDYGLDDDDDEDMLELGDSTCCPSKSTPATQVESRSGGAVIAKDGDEEMDYGLDDLDDDDDNWEADIAKAVGGGSAKAQDKRIFKTPVKPPALKSSLKRNKSPVTRSPSDDYGSDFDPEHVVRFVVLDVFEDEYTSSSGTPRHEKSLRVEDEKTRTERRVLLRLAWMECDVREGDVVNVIGGFDASGTCIIDNTRNMLILHPDILLSATAVADSFDCIRLATLKERVKAISDASQWSVYGNILHELFQAALSANDFSSAFLEKEINRILSAQLQNLYAVRVTPSMAMDHLRTKLPSLQDWAKMFVSAKPKDGAVATGHRAPDANIAIRKVLDIEEHIWSPKYGLKGNIDVSVEVDVRDAKDRSTLTVPLELKTGRNTKVMSHRAQTMLYTLLMSDRYDIESLCGVLYYMETSETIRVPSLVDELRDLMIGRNKLARYIYSNIDLPPMLGDKRTCGKCYAKTSCFVFHKTIENGTAETSGVGDIFAKETAHLNETHSEFFTKWEALLSKEEKDMEKFRKELWVMTSDEREAAGRCFSNLSMIPESAPTSNDQVSKINRFHYRFVKKTPSPSFSFLESQINVGEPIVISDEDGHFALAKGYVVKVSSKWILVAVDRRLHNSRVRQEGFHEKKNQTFSAIMELLEDGSTKPLPPASSQEAELSYRMDKDEFSNGMALIRNNLVELVKADGNPRLRELIVELAPPVYKVSSTAYPLPSASQGKINVDQKNAIEKVMSAQDYALVLGMPGTGKTTTIAHIIRALVHQGKSVLLTSYTHTAVDNILLKIKDDPIKILRLGVASKIHPEVQNFAVLANAPKKSFEEIQDALHSPQVVATTCLSINHIVFTERLFDYCIVDEASQITLPVCVGPIRMAKKFVLVGDHFQLPPLVRSQEAKAGGLDVSLFKLLSDSHPESVVNLEHQYRMCEEIMALSNYLIYEGRLKCGTEKVAQSSLRIPDIGALSNLHRASATPQGGKLCGATVEVPCWIRDMLQEDVKARFLNTDLVVAPEERKGDRIYNPTEAELTRQLVEGFLHCGVDATEIGVVSVYRSQIKAIQHLLHSHPSVEMHTADKFQGRDKDCIIISLVRSNDKENVGELLKDWRRINVAFTRAKTKLLILGSKSTLKTNDLLGKFVDMMEERKWVYDLPANAHTMHSIPMQITQSTQGTASAAMAASQRNRSVDAENKRPVTVQKSILDMLGKKPKDAAAGPKTGTVTQKSVLASRPVLRDIVNELNG
ncbi:DNA replication ATP-dependent helicase/nuclease dna2 [Drechslerella dactyloides]|uniref:DNA replication ATP-dependent helicase/nuclease n=1 Tax=Drechslerella dactyloides TaxID=74499 RepID=A0AAD6IUS5_DREDA|nr:DNA replication ATP-dependent helicase/nuclease dna2 [Drechslerella dactyloides]